MSEQIRNHRKSVGIVAATLGLVLAGGAAFAYWTSQGSGTGTQTTSSDVKALVVTQDPVGVVAPGSKTFLTGTIANPNTTSVKAGVLSAAMNNVGSHPEGLTIGGKATTDGTVIPGNTTVVWSGFFVDYKDLATNQDAMKGATVNIDYTLPKFLEPSPYGTYRVVAVGAVKYFDIAAGIGGGTNAQLPKNPNGQQCSVFSPLYKATEPAFHTAFLRPSDGSADIQVPLDPTTGEIHFYSAIPLPVAPSYSLMMPNGCIVDPPLHP